MLIGPFRNRMGRMRRIAVATIALTVCKAIGRYMAQSSYITSQTIAPRAPSTHSAT